MIITTFILVISGITVREIERSPHLRIEKSTVETKIQYWYYRIYSRDQIDFTKANKLTSIEAFLVTEDKHLLINNGIEKN
jgi:hypothetical protein